MSKKIEFKPPPEYKAPEGKQSGDEFEDVATFKIKPDGTLCLTMIGDIEMPGYDNKAEDKVESRPDSTEFVQRMTGSTESGASQEGY